jgi:hypothetical protein
MMDDLDRAIFFNSIFLVLWAVAFVPYTIREKKYGLLLATFLPLIPFEIYLSWNLREYPFNIMAGVVNSFAGLGAGFLMHYFNERKRKE